MRKVVIIFISLFIFNINLNASEKIKVEFSDCVDGDTIKVLIDGEKTTVRMLAVNTPETVKPGTVVEPYGKEASDLTCQKIKNAKTIELEYDSGSDKTDKYDRVLAWVYVDGELLQSLLIEAGYAKVDYIYGDYLYTDNLYELEKEAASLKKGIWSEEEYVYEEEQSTEEKSLIDEIVELIKKELNNIYKDILKEIKKYFKNSIDEIFN